MTSSTASLLQHLLTRSDLSRLDLSSAQIDEWLASGSVEAIAELPTDNDAGEQVLVVTDPELRAELGGQLATIGKSKILMEAAQVRSLARQVAPDASADADIAALLASVIEQLDGDLENIVRLAIEEPGARATAAVHVPIVDDSEVTDILRAGPNVLADSNVSAWFRDESGAEPGAPLDDLVPLAGEDLEELEATVAFHSEQIERLVDLPHALGELALEVAQLRQTIEAAGMSVPAAAAAPTPCEGAGSTSPGLRSPRTALLGICVALLCWTGLVWFGTGSAALTLSSFVAANVVGYLALQPATWRR